VIRLTVLVTDTTAPVLQQGRGLLIITIIDINEQPPVCLLSLFFTFFSELISTQFYCRRRDEGTTRVERGESLRVNSAIKMKSASLFVGVWEPGNIALHGTSMSIKTPLAYAFNFLCRLPIRWKWSRWKSGLSWEKRLLAWLSLEGERNRKSTEVCPALKLRCGGGG
jgi:hypothetical protein